MGVLRQIEHRDGLDLAAGVDVQYPPGHDLHLWLTNGGPKGGDLPVEIALRHGIVII